MHAPTTTQTTVQHFIYYEVFTTYYHLGLAPMNAKVVVLLLVNMNGILRLYFQLSTATFLMLAKVTTGSTMNKGAAFFASSNSNYLQRRKSFFKPLTPSGKIKHFVSTQPAKEDDNIDLEEYHRSLTPLEKQQMAKDFFSKVLNYNDEMRPECVHIILFNVGTNREGAHTIEFPKNSGNNVLLAFEEEAECDQFTIELKEQEFFDPVVSTDFGFW